MPRNAGSGWLAHAQTGAWFSAVGVTLKGMPEARFEFDERAFPILVVTCPPSCSDQEFKAFLERTGALYSRGQKFVQVFDCMQGGAVSARQRGWQADFNKKYDAQIREMNLGMAFAMSSAMTRGVLTAILWLSPLPCPHAVRSDVAQAIEWAQGQLREGGVDAPSHPVYSVSQNP